MTSGNQSRAAARLKAVSGAIEAFAKFLKGEITRAALNIELQKLEATQPPHKR